MARKKRNKKPTSSTTTVKQRNPYALIASWRSGAGKHPDRKRVLNKSACRGRVDTSQDT